jgi:hypothetical protein
MVPKLDGWVQHGVVPGLTWQLLMREPAPAPAPGATWRPGRLLEFRQDPDGVVRLLRELLLSAVQLERRGQETAVMLRVGTPDGRRSAGVSRAIMRDALQRLVAELVTVDRVDEALRNLPVESAARAIIDGAVTNQREPDELVAELGVLSFGARTLALVRGMNAGDTMLVDPVEVADQAYAGSGEFTCGWWEIRTALGEPARQWVELLEGRFPRARRRQQPTG